MWALNFFDADSPVPSLRTHLRGNVSALKFWYAEDYLKPEHRCGSFVRFIRYLVTLNVYLLVVGLLMSWNDSGYLKSCERRDTCKFNCVDNNYPGLVCGPDPANALNYGGQFYDNVFLYEYRDTPGWRECAAFANENMSKPHSLLPSKQQPRVHACFPSCTGEFVNNGIVFLDDSLGLMGDPERRPACAPGQSPDLLCVDDSEPCQVTRFKNESCFGQGACVQFGLVFLVMFIASPIIFIMELVFLLIARSEIRRDPIKQLPEFKSALYTCSIQWTGVAMSIAAIVLSLMEILSINRHGRPKSFWLMWMFVVIFDVFRSFAVQTAIWYLLLTKGGQIGTQDIVIKGDDDEDEHHGFLAMSHKIILRIVEADKFETATLVLVCFYAALVMVQLTFSDEIEDRAGLSSMFRVIDMVILFLFVAELLLRVLAHGIVFLKDPWNVFDGLIVIVSVVFTFVEFQGKQGLFMLRLMRLMRLVLVLRKASRKASPRRPPGTGPVLTSPVERVLSLLTEIMELKKGVTPKDKENLDWVQDVISSNKLYSVQVEQLKNKQGSDYELELQHWLRLTTDQLQDANWRDEELESILQGKARKAAAQAQAALRDQKLLEEDLGHTGEISSSGGGVATHHHGHGPAVSAVAKKNAMLRRKLLGAAEGSAVEVEEDDSKADVIPDDDILSVSSLDSDFDPDEICNEVYTTRTEALTDELTEFRRTVNSWNNFDVFKWEEVFSQETLLPAVAINACQSLDLFSALDVNPRTFFDFSLAVSKLYNVSNPYSNATHAADVVQSAAILFRWLSEDKPVLGSVELMAAMVAAVGIDVSHPGVNNGFLIATGHPLSIRYCDVSPLENLHAATLFELLLANNVVGQNFGAGNGVLPATPGAARAAVAAGGGTTTTAAAAVDAAKDGATSAVTPVRDPFKRMSEEQFSVMRKLVINALIASDSASHAANLSLFKTKCTRRDFPSARTDDKQVVINTLLHAADISYVAKPMHITSQWVQLMMQEFFRQGDVEKMRHMQVGQFMDREKNLVARCQSGYIEVVVQPMFEALANFLPRFAPEFLPNVHKAKAHYKMLAASKHTMLIDGGIVGRKRGEDSDDEEVGLRNRGKGGGAAGIWGADGHEMRKPKRSGGLFSICRSNRHEVAEPEPYVARKKTL